MFGRYWQEHIEERFGDREVLDPEVAAARFWSELPRDGVLSFFELIRQEFLVPGGLLRPEDPVERLSAPVRTRNPLRWFAVEPRLEDATSELSFQIGTALKRFGADWNGREPTTIDDCVRVWCGVLPPGLRAGT